MRRLALPGFPAPPGVAALEKSKANGDAEMEGCTIGTSASRSTLDSLDEDNEGQAPKRRSDRVKALIKETIDSSSAPQAKFVDWVAFNSFIGIAVMLSSLMIGIEMDVDLGVPGVILNVIFMLIWIGEMLSRVYCYTFKVYIKEAANKLDFFLVWVSVLDVVVMPLFALLLNTSAEDSNLRLVMIFRIARLVRVVRLVRVLTFFRELWLLVKGMCDALPVLTWVMILILLELYVGALIMTAIVGKDCDNTFIDWGNCNEYFGKVYASMFSLFQLMTLDSWSISIARPILSEKPYVAFFFLFFLYTTTFGTMNLVVGVLVDNIIRSTVEDAKKMEKAKEQAQKRELKVLKQIFAHAECDGNGIVDMDEFLTVCERHDVQEHFDMIEIPVSRRRLAKRVFEVLDAEQSGSMTVDQFIERTKQLKAEGKSLQRDQTLLLLDVRYLARRFESLFKLLSPMYRREDAGSKEHLSGEQKVNGLRDVDGDQPEILELSAKTEAVEQRAGQPELNGSFFTQGACLDPMALMESRLTALITERTTSIEQRVDRRLDRIEDHLSRLTSQLTGMDPQASMGSEQHRHGNAPLPSLPSFRGRHCCEVRRENVAYM